MDTKQEKKFFLRLILSLLPLILLSRSSTALSQVFCSAVFVSAFLAGRKRLIISGSITAFSVAFISLGFSFLMAAAFLATTLLLAEIFYISFYPGGKFSRLIILGSIVCLLSNVFNTYIMALSFGVAPVKALFEYPMSQAVKVLDGMGGADADIINLLSQNIAELSAAFEKIAPAVLVLTAVLTCFAAYLFSRYMAEKDGVPISNLPKMSSLRMPRGITGIFLAIFVFSFYFGISTSVLNIITIMMWLLAVCGISVLYYYIKKLSKATPIVSVIILGALLMVFSSFGTGVPLIGVLLGTAVIDSFIPLRK